MSINTRISTLHLRVTGRTLAMAAVAAWALVAMLAISLTTPLRAEAATVDSGALSQLAEPFACVGEVEETVAKCGTTLPYGVNFAYEVQVSPDGRYAYSVAVKGSLVEYARNPANGELTVIGCFSSREKSKPPCAEANAEMEVGAVEEPAAIVISPNGASVYVITQGANNVVEFARNTETGLLTKIGCITGEASSSECATKGAKGLDVPYGIAVSADGENVYVASLLDEAVAEFKRNTETGELIQLEAPNDCISEQPTSECGITNAVGLKEAIGVAVSPDGQNVYVAAGAKEVHGDIAAFARGSGGALEQLPGTQACISEKVAGCATGAHIQGAEDLAVSPDGRNVYANSYPTNAVIELQRGEAGALEQLASPNACVSSEALSSCTQDKALGGALGVAISPDGKSVYATSANENALAAFKRGGEGQLEQLPKDPCVTEEASGCEGASANKLVGLKFARRLTVSPDGTNLYVAGQDDHAIAELTRTVTPSVTGISLAHGPTVGATVKIKGAGFAEDAEVFFGAEPAVNVTVNSATSLTAVSPAGKEGIVSVQVENAAGASAAGAQARFTYTNKPIVAGVSADLGSEAGGTVVTITGSEFPAGASVRFGSSEASAVTVNSATSITATSPPGSGNVDVTVSGSDGTSELSPADTFAYVNGSISPVSGLFLEGYCQSVGFQKVTLAREGVGGPGYAYENWACVQTNGTEVPIANIGAAPSMESACREANPSVTAYAFPEEPNSAFSWGCYTFTPAPSKEGEVTEIPLVLISPPSTLPSLIAPPIVMPAPTLARTGNVAPVSGTVLVKLPGSSTFVSLASLRQIPFGTVIEASHGRVSVTTVGPHGGTQTGEFFSGQFVLTQAHNAMVVATLTGGSFAGCPTARERSHLARASASHSSGKHPVRKLWGNAHGSFSTKGNYAAGAVQGTEWLTEDLCEGTVIKVTRDKVAVTNLVTHRRVEVKAGHRYLAKVP